MVVIQAMTGVHHNDMERNINLELMWRDRLASHLVYDLNFLNLIDKMVKQKWQERYQSAQSILEDLEPIIITLNTGISRPAPQPQPVLLERSQTPETQQKTLQLPDKSNKFKILFGLGIISAIAIPLLLYTTNTQSNNYITYENEHIKLDYPAKWSREISSNF
ncbi:MAG: hypothetical protein ACFCAD_27940 [Pleurocapsa sp.]